MTLVEEYTIRSNEMLEKDEQISGYEKELDKREEYIKNLMINASLKDLICHPFRLMRTSLEKERIRKIKQAYYKIRNSSLFENIKEETGELGDDLEGAARFTKPDRLRKFISKYNISGENIDKKLLKTRK